MRSTVPWTTQIHERILEQPAVVIPKVPIAPILQIRTLP